MLRGFGYQTVAERFVDSLLKQGEGVQEWSRKNAELTRSKRKAAMPWMPPICRSVCKVSCGGMFALADEPIVDMAGECVLVINRAHDTE